MSLSLSRSTFGIPSCLGICFFLIFAVAVHDLSAQGEPRGGDDADSTALDTDSLDITVTRQRISGESHHSTPHPTLPSSLILKPLLQNAVSSFPELLNNGGPLQSYGARVPTGPSAIGVGSLGPETTGLMIDGRRPVTVDGDYLDPTTIPLLRVEGTEEFRGVDASLYSDVSASRVLNLLRPEYDVEGSYLRVGYTGAPGGVSRVALLFARNISDRLTVSAGFRRLAADGFRADEGGELIGGDLDLDFYPDALSRVRLSTEVIELDRNDNGGLTETGDTEGPTVFEESRRRRVGISYYRETGSGSTDSRERSAVESFLSGSLSYDHDGRVLIQSLETDTAGNRGDFLTLSASSTQRISDPLFVRGHLETSVGGGDLERAHAGGLIGLSRGQIRAEAGGAATLYRDGGNETSLRSALLGVVSGDHGATTWRVDGRFFPTVSPLSGIHGPSLDTGGTETVVDIWTVEGLLMRGDSTSTYGLDLAMRSVRTEGRELVGFDAFAVATTTLGLLDVRTSVGYVTLYGFDGLNPQFAGSVGIGFPFRLFGGALDLYAHVRGRVRSQDGGYRYDMERGNWYSDPEDRSDPVLLNPMLAGTLTARIGSAFFTFDFVNLLNSEFWTIRRRPEHGFGLRFGLNWVLID